MHNAMKHVRTTLWATSVQRRRFIILIFVVPITIRYASLVSFITEGVSEPASLVEPRLQHPTTLQGDEAVSTFQAMGNTNQCHGSTRSKNWVDINFPHDGLSIAFVGDSVSRYIYLSLVFYLRWGCWVHDGHPFLELMVRKKMQLKNRSSMTGVIGTTTTTGMTNTTSMEEKSLNIASWNDYLNYTNSLLFPYESCDCYRNWEKQFVWNRHVENRYYSDPTKNYHISFFTKFGSTNIHGHWNAATVYDDHGRQNSLSFAKVPYEWVQNTWDGFVANYISHMNPKPKYFVFNSGFWTGHMLGNDEVLETLRKSLHDNNIIGIYRTTTFRSDEQNYAQYESSIWRKHDRKVCNVFACLNVSWTSNLVVDGDSNKHDYFIDSIHFKSQVYNRINIEFFDLIKSLSKSTSHRKMSTN